MAWPLFSVLYDLRSGGVRPGTCGAQGLGLRRPFVWIIAPEHDWLLRLLQAETAQQHRDARGRVKTKNPFQEPCQRAGLGGHVFTPPCSCKNGRRFAAQHRRGISTAAVQGLWGLEADLQLQLPGDDVEARHVLGDAVLHLQPRVHLRQRTGSEF